MNREELKSLHVAVVAGGWSDERDISLQSGTQCRDALLEAGFPNVDLLDLAQDDFALSLARGGYDVAFLALHGRYGEDGCIQGMLEVLHIPYTFSGVSASAVSSEKELAKAVYDSVASAPLAARTCPPARSWSPPPSTPSSPTWASRCS